MTKQSNDKPMPMINLDTPGVLVGGRLTPNSDISVHVELESPLSRLRNGEACLLYSESAPENYKGQVIKYNPRNNRLNIKVRPYTPGQ